MSRDARGFGIQRWDLVAFADRHGVYLGQVVGFGFWGTALVQPEGGGDPVRIKPKNMIIVEDVPAYE